MTVMNYSKVNPCKFTNVTTVSHSDEFSLVDIAVTWPSGLVRTIRVTVEKPMQGIPIDILEADYVEQNVDINKDGSALTHVAFQADIVRKMIAGALAEYS